MNIIEWIKKLILRKEQYMLNDIDKSVEERDNLAIEVAKALHTLYESLEKKENKKLYYMLRIIDKEIAKSCGIEDIKLFIKKIRSSKTIKSYELSTACINTNDDKDKITVKISDENIVEIDYQSEIRDANFEETLRNIENIIKVNTNKISKINIIKSDKHQIENVDFGILGNYQLHRIEYKTNAKLSKSEIENEKRKIINDYNKNLDEINKKIFYKIYDELKMTDYNLWEHETFEKIINRAMLPKDFDDLDEKQKRDILYFKDNYNYQELWKKINEEKMFWNLDNIKNDVVITNVIIDADYKNICMEFYGICDFFVAYIELNYEKNYTIEQFDPS